MIELPDRSRVWDWSNNFYLSCGIEHIAKPLAHYELFKATLGLHGAIVECGVFKGCSLVRLALLRELHGNPLAKPIIGFDTFGEFPDTQHEDDKAPREKFIGNAGNQSIAAEQLRAVLREARCDRAVDLVEGDICETVPRYCQQHPELRISLLNLDVDIREPAVVVLEHLFPRVVSGGVVMLDDYGIFPGETQAVDEYLQDHGYAIQQLPIAAHPAYVVKE